MSVTGVQWRRRIIWDVVLCHGTRVTYRWGRLHTSPEDVLIRQGVLFARTSGKVPWHGRRLREQRMQDGVQASL